MPITKRNPVETVVKKTEVTVVNGDGAVLLNGDAPVAVEAALLNGNGEVHVNGHGDEVAVTADGQKMVIDLTAD